jgi:hypothetical protein
MLEQSLYIGDKMLTLVISHNIALTKEERYKLHLGETIDVIGVSVPVWFEKGNTSEPANEVFTIYRLTNKPESHVVKTNVSGYEINMPQQPEKDLEKVPPNIVESLGIQKELPTSKNLLDIKDGGSEFIQFRQYAQSNLIIDGKKTKKPLNIVHCIEIRAIESLSRSLAYDG